MKMMQGAFFLACSNMSRTRLAPTPTNISTKSEPEIVKNGTLASPAMARASSVLPVPGGPTSSTPRGMRPPSRWNLLRIAQEFDDLLEVLLGLVDAGDVLKGDPPMRLGQELGAGLAEADRLAAGPLHLPRQKNPHPDDGDQRQPVDEQRHQPIGAFRRRLGRDGHILFIEALDQRRVVWRIGRKGPVVGEMAGDLIARDRNLADMALINLVQELAEGDVLRRHPLARVLKQHHERNDEQDYDHPKCKIPEIRIHLRSRYWLQGVLISMLGSGSKDGDPNLRRGCALFHALGHCNCAATTVVRNNFLSFRILPPAGSIQRGKPRVQLCRDMLWRNQSANCPRQRSIIQPARHRADPHSRAQVLGHGQEFAAQRRRPQARTSRRTRTSSAAEQQTVPP